MSENRVVIKEGDQVKRIKTDKEIVEENEQLEKMFKAQVKEENMTVMLVDEPDRALNFGVVGIGQAGSRIAEQFYRREYKTVIINTALQDMKHINIPERQKLFLDYALGGTGKDLESGRAAVEEYSDEIMQLLEGNFDDSDVLVLCASGGGGSGSGGLVSLVNLASQLGKPVVVIFAMPLSSEDAISKHNTIQTLSQLASLAASDTINSLLVVDNARIDVLYPNLSMANFWETANNAIVEPLHMFNTLSAQPSQFTALDAMDFGRTLLANDCATLGMIEVDDYMEEDSVAEAVLSNLENGLLASEFDLSKAQAAAVVITGSANVLEQIPASNLEYAMAMVNKLTDNSSSVFKGIYALDDHPDNLRIYSIFSGLGLPQERVNELKAEALKYMQGLENKQSNRASNMSVDLGKSKATSATDRIHDRIKNKKSAMGKLTRNSRKVVDKRRK